MSPREFARKFIRAKIYTNKVDPNLPKFEVFGHFLEFESLNFLDFAYYDRQARYLTGESDKVGEQIFRVQIWAI